ncbi:MAG: AAA family ATPase [Promethearchaeota archaeon]
MRIPKIIKEIQEEFNIIGRENELKQIILAHSVRKHLMLEGDVGVGKTTLAQAVATYFDSHFFRIDCSEDTLTHNLIGYFDPPLVISKGYVEDSYVYGPLPLAMMNGGCLFINEVNRMPESTQNILLTALDERMIEIPKLKTIHAKEGFFVIATLNPAAHVGVTALGEALKDRFIWIHLDYQSPEEELEIIKKETGASNSDTHNVIKISQKIMQKTREHSSVRRGSSIRGGIDLAELMMKYENPRNSKNWVEASIMALYNKIELEDGLARSKKEVITDIVLSVLNESDFQ